MTRITMTASALLALASAASAFSPLPYYACQSQSPLAASSTSTTLEKVPYFVTIVDQETTVDTNNVLLESLTAQTTTTTPTTAPLPKKKVTPPSKTGASHKEGVFSPIVALARKIMGEQTLNKVRGKAISLHSDVIGSFVETADWPTGQAALRVLFQVADKDGSGQIDHDELIVAFRSLGFTWLQEKQVRGIFDRADKDKNGSIDMEEWMTEAPKTLRTNLIKLAKKNGGDMGLLA